MEQTGTYRRLHLFEFEDFTWFPEIIRSGGTDYLRYFLIRTELYKPITPLLKKAMLATGNTRIVDLCSGGGGCVAQLIKELNTDTNIRYTAVLTDKFPNLEAFRLIREKSQGVIDFSSTPVDVFHVSEGLKGFRVLFSAAHHFKPNELQVILQDAVRTKSPIAFFDGEAAPVRLIPIIGLAIIHSIAFILFTPFFRPFKLSRLFFTYLLPLIPIYTIWDGIVSLLRMYTPQEFKRIAEAVDDQYVWEYGKTKNRFGIKATYLIGYPKTQ